MIALGGVVDHCGARCVRLDVLNALLSRGLRRIALSLAMISPLAVLRRDWYSLLWPGPKTMGCFG
jgi:hypothetical protein